MATLQGVQGNKFMARFCPFLTPLTHESPNPLQLSVVGLDYACQLVAEVCDETTGAPVVGEGGGRVCGGLCRHPLSLVTSSDWLHGIASSEQQQQHCTIGAIGTGLNHAYAYI